MSMIYSMYAFIVFIATTIGAIAGLGGGIIIKPLFDILGYNDASTIGVLSSFAVFVMSIVSIIKQVKKDTVLKLDLILLMSFGSFIGGIYGESLFQLYRDTTQNDIQVKTLQSILLIVVLVFIIIYRLNEHKIVTFNLKNWFFVFLVGLGLGSLSIFLGIGGGPLNIVFLSLLFSFEVKESVLYSIIMVFFAQISKLGQVYLTNHFLDYNPYLILWVCIFALIGGYIGSIINNRMEDKNIRRVYDYTMVVLLVICLFNVFCGLSFI